MFTSRTGAETHLPSPRGKSPPLHLCGRGGELPGQGPAGTLGPNLVIPATGGPGTG